MKIRVIALLITWFVVPAVFAADQSDLEEILSEIQTVRSDIQKSTTSFLLISKQMEAGETTSSQTDEDKSSQNPLAVDPQIRELAERFYSNIQEQYDRALSLFAQFDKAYDDFSASEKATAQSVNFAFQDAKEKIQTYVAYADHYYDKLQPYQSPEIAKSGGNEISYEGTASLRLGTSSYEANVEESTTSRNLNLNGSVIFNPQSRLNINLNHNNDVVKTPYTSNDVNLAFQHRTTQGTRLQGTVLYNSYNDENLDQNNFQNVGVGANIEHPINQETRVFGDILANSKTYDLTGGNDFKGARFNAGIAYTNPTVQANGGVRGRVQNSDISALEYSRIIPNASVRLIRKSGSINIRGELEQLAYATAAEVNDFNRGRVDLEWAGRGSQTSFSFISKKYPNNESFDNNTFRLQNRWNRSSGLATSRTSAYIQYISYSSTMAQASNYIDLRVDNNHNSESSYFDVNLFGRYWEEEGLEHQLNLFSRFGIKYSYLQIGPALGAQIMINPDDLQIERAGNTLRAGVDARVNAVIQKATFYGNVRFQKSIIYSVSATPDEVDKRMPTTIEVDAGLQVPIMTALDLEIDVSYYNVDLDFSDNLGPNVNQTQTGLRFLAGISYRFQGRQ